MNYCIPFSSSDCLKCRLICIQGVAQASAEMGEDSSCPDEMVPNRIRYGGQRLYLPRLEPSKVGELLPKHIVLAQVRIREARHLVAGVRCSAIVEDGLYDRIDKSRILIKMVDRRVFARNMVWIDASRDRLDAFRSPGPTNPAIVSDRLLTIGVPYVGGKEIQVPVKMQFLFRRQRCRRR